MRTTWIKVGEAKGMTDERGRRKKGKKEPNRLSNMAVPIKN